MAIAKQTTDFLAQRLAEALHSPVTSLELRPVGGGSINDTYQLTVNRSENFFLKRNDARRYPGLFEKEGNGLRFLSQQHCLFTPAIICCDVCNDDQLLILEWVTAGRSSGPFWKKFGEQLARLHQCSNDRFGFAEDNYMGALPQTNTFHGNWTDFFVACRLVPQIQLAIRKNLLTPAHVNLFEQLYKKLDSIFNKELPCLLHGDLWSGNFMCNSRSEPVLIDPAVYYGHRSMDLAMTTLFGGFDKGFYESYHYHFPLPPNHREQWELCNLYPLLIHLNLFGPSYLPSIKSTLEKFD